MMSLSQEVTCLVPQARMFFDLAGERGTLRSEDDTPSPVRVVPCQALMQAVGGERGAPKREESGLEMPGSLGEVSGEERLVQSPVKIDDDWDDGGSLDELLSASTVQLLGALSVLLTAGLRDVSFLSEATDDAAAAVFAPR